MTIHTSAFDPMRASMLLKGSDVEFCQYLRGALGALGGAGSSLYWTKAAADSLAADATAEFTFGHVDVACSVTGITVSPAAALTAHATNYANIIVGWRDGLGGALQTIGTIVTKPKPGSAVVLAGTGNWTSLVNLVFTVGLANVALPAGAILRGSITKASAGVVVPAFDLFVTTQGS